MDYKDLQVRASKLILTHDTLASSLCKINGYKNIGSYTKCIDNPTNVVMDDYWCLVGDKQILTTMIPKLKNPDFWTKLDPINVDQRSYLNALQLEDETIGTLTAMGLLNDYEFKDKSKVK